MSLFSKKQAAPLLPEITYDEVVDYLRNLAATDYTKITKVVNIYRNADKDVKKVLNIKDVPTDVNHLEPNSFLEDDTELGNFLDDEPVKVTKIKVSNAPTEKTKKK